MIECTRLSRCLFLQCCTWYVASHTELYTSIACCIVVGTLVVDELDSFYTDRVAGSRHRSHEASQVLMTSFYIDMSPFPSMLVVFVLGSGLVETKPYIRLK